MWGGHESLGVERKMCAMGNSCVTYSEQPLQFIMTAKVWLCTVVLNLFILFLLITIFDNLHVYCTKCNKGYT